MPRPLTITCPKCGEELKSQRGAHSVLYTCPDPDCNYSRLLSADDESALAAKHTHDYAIEVVRASPSTFALRIRHTPLGYTMPPDVALVPLDAPSLAEARAALHELHGDAEVVDLLHSAGFTDRARPSRARR
jgi:ssDNA-binding Zn-finger/Zn-ribbon topoisomerase 1